MDIIIIRGWEICEIWRGGDDKNGEEGVRFRRDDIWIEIIIDGYELKM